MDICIKYEARNVPVREGNPVDFILIEELGTSKSGKAAAAAICSAPSLVDVTGIDR